MSTILLADRLASRVPSLRVVPQAESDCPTRFFCISAPTNGAMDRSLDMVDLVEHWRLTLAHFHYNPR